MSNSRNLIRFNTNITKELMDWLNEESERTGISKSAINLMALTQYKNQKDVMDRIPELLNAVNTLQSMEQK